MNQPPTPINMPFAIGAALFMLSIFLFFAPPGYQLPVSLLSFIFLLVGHRNAPPPPKEPVKTVTSSHTVAAHLKTGVKVIVDIYLECPSDANPDDLRYHIPKRIFAETVAYFSALDKLPLQLDLEYHLVIFARKLAAELRLAPIILTVGTMVSIQDNPPEQGIVIGAN